MSRRKLRKAEQAEVDEAVAVFLERVRPHLEALERDIVEKVIPVVRPELAEPVGRAALNAIGNELYFGIEAGAIIAADPPASPGR